MGNSTAAIWPDSVSVSELFHTTKLALRMANKSYFLLFCFFSCILLHFVSCSASVVKSSAAWENMHPIVEVKIRFTGRLTPLFCKGCHCCPDWWHLFPTDSPSHPNIPNHLPPAVPWGCHFLYQRVCVLMHVRHIQCWYQPGTAGSKGNG